MRARLGTAAHFCEVVVLVQVPYLLNPHDMDGLSIKAKFPKLKEQFETLPVDSPKPLTIYTLDPYIYIYIYIHICIYIYTYIYRGLGNRVQGLVSRPSSPGSRSSSRRFRLTLNPIRTTTWQKCETVPRRARI